MSNTQKLRITATLELDARMYPPDDEDSQDWLVNDVLLGDINGLILHSNEVGDELGVLHIEQVNGDEQELALHLLNELVNDDECWFDHHGGCQAHGFLDLKPGEVCPNQQARDLIARTC